MQSDKQSEATGPLPLDADQAAAAPGSRPADASRIAPVTLSFPADRDQVVLARSVAGHIAARMGMSVAELTDLRLAVDEACGLFLLSPGFEPQGATLTCSFAEETEQLTVRVSAPVPGGFEPDVEDVGWIMLGAIVDELEWARDGSDGAVTLTKRLAVRPS